jgi:RimJ/RimL family protein N-acetyltransferase
MANPVVVAGPRISLSEFTPTDHADLYTIYSDPTTTANLSFEPRTAEHVKELLQRIEQAANVQPGLDYTLAVTLNDTSQLIGASRLALGTPDRAGPNAGLRPDSPAAQFGLAIHAPYWRNGYGREALGLLIEYAFMDLMAEEVWGARGPANIASAALMKAAGFTETMTIQNHIVKNGQPRDSVVHVLHKNSQARTQPSQSADGT